MAFAIDEARVLLQGPLRLGAARNAALARLLGIDSISGMASVVDMASAALDAALTPLESCADIRGAVGAIAAKVAVVDRGVAVIVKPITDLCGGGCGNAL